MAGGAAKSAGGRRSGAGAERPETRVTAQRIRLTDITLPLHIGVTEAERADRQRVRIDIVMEVEPAPPVADKITEVVDYGRIVNRIREVCERAQYRLVESLAEELAEACFLDDQVLAVRVGILKLDRYADIGGVGCEIERRRVAP
jgi:dihydroneopterin aldolase